MRLILFVIGVCLVSRVECSSNSSNFSEKEKDDYEKNQNMSCQQEFCKDRTDTTDAREFLELHEIILGTFPKPVGFNRTEEALNRVLEEYKTKVPDHGKDARGIIAVQEYIKMHLEVCKLPPRDCKSVLSKIKELMNVWPININILQYLQKCRDRQREFCKDQIPPLISAQEFSDLFDIIWDEEFVGPVGFNRTEKALKRMREMLITGATSRSREDPDIIARQKYLENHLEVCKLPPRSCKDVLSKIEELMQAEDINVNIRQYLETCKGRQEEFCQDRL